MTPADIAAELCIAIEEAQTVFAEIDEARSAHPPQPGKWCAREVVGHLIDSACNNHRRFVLGRSPDLRRFDGYQQDDWVERQRYREASWRDLVELWGAYNRHLAHVIGATPAGALQHRALSPDANGEVTLGFLMEDYVRHLRHHLEQIRSIAAGLNG